MHELHALLNKTVCSLLKVHTMTVAVERLTAQRQCGKLVRLYISPVQEQALTRSSPVKYEPAPLLSSSSEMSPKAWKRGPSEP